MRPELRNSLPGELQLFLVARPHKQRDKSMSIHPVKIM